MGYDMEMDDFHEDDKHKQQELRPSFFDKLTKEEQEELDKLIKEITEEAKLVVEDYAKNPSEVSGSVIQIHEDSPLLRKDKK
tara:strand:+ start:1586 stop:1831 length:246 start_codon:yes stop_codon:yes gene_type:complete